MNRDGHAREAVAGEAVIISVGRHTGRPGLVLSTLSSGQALVRLMVDGRQVEEVLDLTALTPIEWPGGTGRGVAE